MNNQFIQEEVQQITDQLLRHYQPKKIILFGSAVQSDKKPNDLDFFIINDNVPNRGIERMREVRSKIKKTMAADFLIVTPEEFQERLRLGDPFLNHIVTTGKVLYG